MTSNLVYAITCNKCTDIAYIGQTGQTLRQRLNGHKYDIRHKLLDKPVAQHFSGRDHSLDNFRVRVLRGGKFGSQQEREIYEQSVIVRLGDCVINVDSGFLSAYSDCF